MLGDTPMMRETRARLADTDLTVLDVELIFLRPEHRPSDALAVLDAGHRLGARFALVLGYDAEESRLADRFAWLCAEAEQRGIRPGLEFMKYSPVQNLEAAVRIVQRAGHPAGAVLVDAWPVPPGRTDQRAARRRCAVGRGTGRRRRRPDPHRARCGPMPQPPTCWPRQWRR